VTDDDDDSALSAGIGLQVNISLYTLQRDLHGGFYGNKSVMLAWFYLSKNVHVCCFACYRCKDERDGPLKSRD